MSRRCFHIEDRRDRGIFQGKKGHFPPLTGIATQRSQAKHYSTGPFLKLDTVLNFLGIAALEHK